MSVVVSKPGATFSNLCFMQKSARDDVLNLTEDGEQSSTGEISGENALHRVPLNSHTELSQQISELRRIIEVQGESIRRLANVMQERGDVLRTNVQ
jgi:hypothetical protein